MGELFTVVIIEVAVRGLTVWAADMLGDVFRVGTDSDGSKFSAVFLVILCQDLFIVSGQFRGWWCR